MAIPKVAAIHDLSGLGKCSLTAAIPILAALGVQACPMPTAVLSNQTGFPSYTGQDLTAQLEGFAQAWKRLGVRLDGVYTGFLCNNRQIDFVSSFVRDFAEPGILVLIDPVLADNGQYYALFDHSTCRAMSSLIRQATVITPNLTEACFLTGRTAGDYAALAAKPDPDLILEMVRTLSRSGPETVVISGIPAGEEIAILGYQSRKDEAVWVKNRRIGPGYSGTGDILASVLCGCLIRGKSLSYALEKAACLLERSVARAYEEGVDPNEGVAFEEYLYLLAEPPQERLEQRNHRKEAL